MFINPQQKKKNLLFYNNICFIVCIFCAVCFITGLFLQNSTVKEKKYTSTKDYLVGPINVSDKNQVFKITAYFNGDNSSTYISGEVLDKNEDTLYEFGKDLWHESGYDSEGSWSESDRKMVANITLEKGTYFLKFHTEENSMKNIVITVIQQKGSYIAHLQAGTSFMIFLLIVWLFINRKWVKEKLVALNDKLEEMSEEDD